MEKCQNQGHANVWFFMAFVIDRKKSDELFVTLINNIFSMFCFLSDTKFFD